MATLGLAVALVAPASTAAQGESPEARELAGLTFWPAAYEFAFTNAAQMGAITAKAGLERRLGRPLTEDESRRLGEVFLRVWKAVAPPQAQVEALYRDVLTRHYSVQEMKDLVAFYRTPLGVKTLRFSTVSNEEMRAGIDRMMASSQQEFVERFTAEFAPRLPRSQPRA